MNAEELKVEIWTRLEDEIRYSEDKFGDLVKNDDDFQAVCWILNNFKICWEGGDLKNSEVKDNKIQKVQEIMLDWTGED